MSIIGRLYRIARSHVPDGDHLKERLFRRKGKGDAGGAFRSRRFEGDKSSGEERARRKEKRRQEPESMGPSEQFLKDLAAFNLKPPSSLEEVKKARNREIKKYHSDRFMNDPEKLETSKEIMQILNSAFDRLKKHYEEKDRR